MVGSLGVPRHLGAVNGLVEVRRVGLSRVGENTLLTVVLDRMVEPRVTPRTEAGKPQLAVEFPQARAGRLPTRLAGDDLLVEQITTESSPGGGVRIILDLFPDAPYKFWKKAQRGAGGQVFYVVGLQPDTTAPQVERSRPEPPPAPEVVREREPEPAPAPEDYGYKEERGVVGTGSFAEVRKLLPSAGSLFQGLEADGWGVAESHQYDRPGQRFSRDFLLTNRQYPELVVKIAYLPANAPNTPNIGFVTLSTENLKGDSAAKYQELRRWSFARIKQNYEDIGDFFDDALKPLRIKLREETKSLTLRDARVFQNFLQRAVPRNPRVAEQVMSHVREKVNPRFEGVQYTVSEDPLVILSLVDFLYVKVYFLENR
jgi:hypothetical protein